MRRPAGPRVATSLAGVAALAALVVALVAALTSPATAAPAVRYVALGDSYSSGVGAGSYAGSSGSCDRSAHAYPQLWAAAHSPAAYVSVACSGATTTDVIRNQVSALGTGTTLVSITVGGNDVGFSAVMQNCVLHGTSACVSGLNSAEDAARTRLPDELDAAYAQIRGHAPFAHVVVLGYPRLYDTGVWYCVGLSSTSRKKINEAADVLDGVVAAAAARHGFSFADVRSRFAAGHEICDGDSSWLHSVDWSDMASSYHPSAGGQRSGYLPAFSAHAP